MKILNIIVFFSLSLLPTAKKRGWGEVGGGSVDVVVWGVCDCVENMRNLLKNLRNI